MTSDEQPQESKPTTHYERWKSRLRQIFKSEPAFTNLRNDLRAAIEAGTISEDDDVHPVVSKYFDSVDLVMFFEAIEESNFEVATVRELLWLLDRADAEEDRNRRKKN